WSKKIAELRKKKGLSQTELAKILGVARSTVGMWETGDREPDAETFNRLAGLFHVPVDYLLGRTDDPTPLNKGSLPPLTPKDERDIAKDLERIMQNLESNNPMAFYGEPMDEQTKELLRISLENSMRLAKQIAKQKFTPKKYRGNGDD